MSNEHPNFERLRWIKQASYSKPGSVHLYAEQGNIAKLEECVRLALERGTAESLTLMERDTTLGCMPIHVAAEYGQVETIRYLIKKHVDLDAGDTFRVSAVHLAAIENNYEALKLLLESEAVLNNVNTEGDLPIHWAATKGHTEVIKLLVKYNSPIDPVNNSKWTPLHRAAYNGRKAAVGLLVGMGASMAAKNKDGNNVLHLACFQNQLSVIQHLMSLGCDMEARNNNDKTAYDLCIVDGAREILEDFGYKYVLNNPRPVPAAAAALTGEAAAAAEPKAQHDVDPGPAARRRFVPDLDDDFPDAVSHLAPSMRDPSMASMNRPSSFLEEVRRNDSLMANASPYEAPKQYGHRQYTSVTGASPSSFAAPTRTADNGLRMSFKMGSGPPLPPIGSSSSSAGSRVPGSSAPPGEDYQDVIRAENRRMASELAVNEALTPRKRPISANKKFLNKYNLAGHGLFAP